MDEDTASGLSTAGSGSSMSVSSSENDSENKFDLTLKQAHLKEEDILTLKNISTKYIPPDLRYKLNIHGWGSCQDQTGEMEDLGYRLGLNPTQLKEVRLSNKECFDVLLRHCENKCINIGHIYTVMGDVDWSMGQEKIAGSFSEIIDFYTRNETPQPQNREPVINNNPVPFRPEVRPKLFIFFSPSDKEYVNDVVYKFVTWLKEVGFKTHVDIWRQEKTNLDPEHCWALVKRNLLASDYIIVIPSSYLKNDLKPYWKTPTYTDQDPDGPHTIALFKEIDHDFDNIRNKLLAVLPSGTNRNLLPSKFKSISSFKLSRDTEKKLLIGHLMHKQRIK